MPLDECEQRVEGLGREEDRLAIAKEHTLDTVDPEIAEPIPPAVIFLRHGRSLGPRMPFILRIQKSLRRKFIAFSRLPRGAGASFGTQEIIGNVSRRRR